MNLRVRDRPRWQRDLLAGCDPEQAHAITTPATPLCVLAGAGSGKTRVLTRRIAWRVLDDTAAAGRVLALTFTRKAASEMHTRLGALGLPEAVAAGTFHSMALAELRRLAAEQGDRPPVVLGSKARTLLDVLEETGRRGLVDAPSRSPAPARRRREPAKLLKSQWRSVADLAAEIEWAKSRCLQPGGFVRASAFAGRSGTWEAAEVAEIWEGYELLKRRRGVLDFEDLLIRCTDRMLSDPLFAASARWRYRHLFVDEYQDVNEAQQRLLRAWLGDNDDLCVVGDPHQAIYSWNGSNPKAITEFAGEFPGATVLQLSVNYRSTAEVQTVAGAVLGQTQSARAGGARPEGPIPTLVSYADEAAEAAGVAEAARRARRPGRSWSQMAVLARTNAQLPAIEAALSAAGVPCFVASGSGQFAKPWVQEALREAAHAADPPALFRWATDLLAANRTGDEDGADVGQGAAAEEAGSAASMESGVEEEDEARLDLQALARLADEYLAEDVAATGAGFRNWLEASYGRNQARVRRDTVELTTFHRSKGLEWAVVFVIGLEDGYVPIAHARDPDALAEERRLLYVACTRAAEELHCSWATERSFSPGRPIPRSPSPWLSAIAAAHRDLERLRVSSPDHIRQALAESRRALLDG